MAGSVIGGFRAMMEEFWEQEARHHDELVTLLREVAVSRGYDVSNWDSKENNRVAALNVGARDVEDSEGTISDHEESSEEPGKELETTVAVKPSVVEDIDGDCCNQAEVRGSPVIKQNKDEYMVHSSNRVSCGWSPVTKTKTETKNLDQKQVVMDIAFENQKQESFEREFGCKGVGREEKKMVVQGDIRDNYGYNGDCLVSYNSYGVRRLASDYNKGKVHGFLNMKRSINITRPRGRLVSESGACWPIDEGSIFYKRLNGEVFDIEAGSREVHNEDDYPWDPGIKVFKATP